MYIFTFQMMRFYITVPSHITRMMIGHNGKYKNGVMCECEVKIDVFTNQVSNEADAQLSPPDADADAQPSPSDADADPEC